MCQKEECYLIEVGYGFNTKQGERGFNRGSYVPYQTVSAFARGRSNYSVFASAYRYSDKQVDKSDLYGDLYLDFDDVENFERVRKDALTALSYLKIVYHIEETQVRIYFSGNKGVHIIVPAEIFGIEPMPLLNGVFKTIAMSIRSFTPNKTIDTKIYDNKRMFRIPNSIHEKSNLYKIPLTPQELRTVSHQEIQTMATQPRDMAFSKVIETNHIAEQQFKKAIDEFYLLDKEAKKDKRYKSKYDFTPPCIQHILTNGALEGQRNISIACLTGFYKNSGKSLNETMELIAEWNSNNAKPTGEMEMKKTIKSIFGGDKIFGCSTLKLISVCNESQCKLAKKKEVNTNVNTSKVRQNQTKR